MDNIRNPFAPGAGSIPPELSGRDDIIEAASIALQRVVISRSAKSQIFLGLRGTGKTVLLNRIEQMAEEHNHLTSFVEAPENKSLPDILYPSIYQVLRQLSLKEKAKATAYSAMRALQSFASAFKISVGNTSLAVDPEIGTADSGDLEFDLSELFIKIGEAAKADGRAWTLFIDEIQYLKKEDYSALISALHRVNQKQLPILFFGAGLPQVAALSGNAKSYAERLFDYPPLGPLDHEAACTAIKNPINDERESINDDALQLVASRTEGYPFFLQEWGYQSWSAAEHSPITIDDIETASQAAQKRLDEGFFRVRFDRLTPKEREYVLTMASLGKGPYRSADLAEKLGESAQSLGPRRATIINKGMIYSKAHGDIDFTVPMFDDYLRRTYTKPSA
jgi:hypothetical protein